MAVLVIRYSDYFCAPLLRRDRPTYLVTAAPVPDAVRDRFRHVYTVSSYDAIDELASIAGDLWAKGVDVDRVASFTERTQYAAGYLADALGARGPSSRSVLATRDKRVMKSLVGAAGVPCARFVSVPDCAATDPARIEADLGGYPIILKPVDGFGSTMTSRVETRAALVDALADFAADGTLQATAEQFIDGQEFHVDAVWRDGEPWMFCVSRYFLPPLSAGSGMEGSVQLPRHDHPELYDRMLAMHRQVNTALDIENGATHLEAFQEQGTDRIVFSEVASRIGGGAIATAVGAACGLDEREIATHEMLGEPRETLAFAAPQGRYVAWTNIAPTRSGTISAVPDPSSLLTDHSVVSVSVPARVGDEADLTKRCAWYALVVVAADSEEAVTAHAARLRSRYALDTVPNAA